MPFCIQCGSEVSGTDRYCQNCLSQSQGPIETASATETPYTAQPQPTYIPPVNAPYENPVNTPDGTPYGAPANTPFDNPVSAPFETPYGAPGSVPYGNPVGAPFETPYGAPGNVPYGNPVGAPFAPPYGAPGTPPYGNPVGAPVVTPTSFYLDLIKNLLIKPGITLPQFLTYNNFYPGALIALLSALVISLTGLLAVKTLPLVANIFIESFDHINMIGYVDTSDILKSLKSLTESLSKSVDIPYLAIFFKLFLGVVLQWAIVSAMTLASSKLFGSRLTPMQAFNVTGATTLYLASAAILGLLFGYISITLYSLIFIGGAVASYITLHKAIEPTLAENQPLNPYVLPLAMTGTAVVNLIIMKLAA